MLDAVVGDGRKGRRPSVRTMTMDWRWRSRRPEPFDAGPLRRHGDRLPVAHAVQCGMPDFVPPDWPPGREALRGFSGLLSGVLARAVRDRLLCVRQLPGWLQARQAMEGVFGFHRAHHFFHAAPLGWVAKTDGTPGHKGNRAFSAIRRPHCTRGADRRPAERAADWRAVLEVPG